MAVSGKVYSKSDFSIGIKNKVVDGSSVLFSTAAANNTAYELLPVINVSAPVLNLVESGEIRSNNAGMIELDTDQFRTTKGGFITMDFEVPAERDMIVRMLANVLQDHGESGSGPYIHTIQATSGQALSRPDFTANSSSGVPSMFDIGLYYPESAQDKMITSAVLQSLTMNFDMTDGRCLLSGTFYSGMTSSSKFLVEQTLSANSAAPTLMSTSPTQIESYFDVKKLDVDGTSLADAVITGVSFTFENNVARVGRDSNGDAEGYAFGIPSVNITGEISLMYDANFDFGSGGNVLQDFLSGNTATLKLQQGDGTVSTAGEMNIECEIYSTAVNLDPNADTGAVITIPFKVVQPTSSGAASGTAFKFEYADSTQASGW
tara:strand:+ start:4332 stop:5459 length:1128 start_codon:yes stop_codon:yes gene_type:complete